MDLICPDFFKALADPNRIKLLSRFCDCCDGCCVKDAADCCNVDLSVVSRHLAQMSAAGLLSKHKRGKHVHYQIAWKSIVSTLRTIADAIEECCHQRDSNCNQNREKRKEKINE